MEIKELQFKYEDVNFYDMEDKHFCIEIYFIRRNVKIVIERWKFALVSDKGKKFRNIYSVKKLSTLIRTVYSYTRLLPAFHLFLKKGFDYVLDYKLYYNDQNLSKDTDDYFKTKCNVFKNACDISIGKINLQIEFLLKNDIFKIEEEMVFYIYNF